jgi:hypothetical protein
MCPERERLTAEYLDTVFVYGKLLVLDSDIAAESARVIAEQAKDSMLRHAVEHG